MDVLEEGVDMEGTGFTRCDAFVFLLLLPGEKQKRKLALKKDRGVSFTHFSE